MFFTVAVTALLCGAAQPAPDTQLKTLWLVRPLYPGQELLVARTEEAINQLIPAESRSGEIIGSGELAKHLDGKSADLGCVFGDQACSDPIAALVTSLKLDRVVLIKGGQDESGYRFKVASFKASSGESSTAEGSNAALSKALLGALVKVVPLASTLEVSTTPPGISVLIDGEKVGETPLSTQVLPGERVIRFEGPSSVPVEVRQRVPVRGKLTLSQNIEQVPARVVLNGSPVGTEIFIDGRSAGTDKVERGIVPGHHVLKWSRADYEPVERSVDVSPGDTVRQDQVLTPTSGMRVRSAMEQSTKKALARSWDISISADLTRAPGASTFGWAPSGTPTAVDQAASTFSLPGAFAEIGGYNGFFGFSLIGVGYGASSQPRTFAVGGNTPSTATAVVKRYALTALQPHIRIQIWNFQIFAQAGVGVVGYSVDASPVNTLSLMLSGRATLRYFIWEGLFIEAGWGLEVPASHLNIPVLGPSPITNGFQGGLGYAF